MLDNIFKKSKNSQDQDLKDKDTLIQYLTKHAPDLKFIDFTTSYAVRTFIFKATVPSLIKSYLSQNMRYILDAVLETNGCNVNADAGKIIIYAPRKEKETLYLGDGIEKIKTIPKTGDITCYVGENTVGESVFIDMEKENHMLIAGQSGSGKSTCIHNIILTLLLRYDKNECIFYLADPKSDLTRYDSIPSVIRTADKKSEILNLTEALINEMKSRQDEMKSMKLIDWNKKHPDKTKSHIVFIFDEIDNIIGKNVSDEVSNVIKGHILTLVKQGRSAGIHVILASQRPVKANLDTSIKSEIKARIALKLDTPTDSRIMLNQSGAEKLTGDGDAYFTNGDVPKRIQVAYAEWDEIDAAISSLKASR